MKFISELVLIVVGRIQHLAGCCRQTALSVRTAQALTGRTGEGWRREREREGKRKGRKKPHLQNVISAAACHHVATFSL